VGLRVAAHAIVRDGEIHLTAMLASTDGRVLLRADDTGVDPEALGNRLAQRLLEDAGGRDLVGILRLTEHETEPETS
jgi:porphobilinogen deaminase